MNLPAPTPAHASKQFAAARWEEYRGEWQANRVRILGILLFYCVELLNYHGLSLGPVQWPRREDVTVAFHQSITALAVAWVMAAGLIHAQLVQKIFPVWLKYASTAVDLGLLTAVLCVSDGPRSPLIVGYFVVVTLAGLRWNVYLVYSATAGAIAGYLCVLGIAKWFSSRPITVPRYHEAMVIIALVLVGLTMVRIVARARELLMRQAASETPLEQPTL